MTKIILNLGVPRSGSTWLFNVILSILEAELITHSHGFAETYSEFLEIFDPSKDYCLVKAHKLDQQMIERCYGENWLVFTTTRSPGDSIVSQMDMFGVDLAGAAYELLNTLAALDELKTSTDLVLVYEDNFFSSLDTIDKICDLAKIPAAAPVKDKVFRAHLSRSIKKSISEAPVVEEIEDLGKVVRLAQTGSHWYQGHVKDGKIGKYKDRLSRLQQQYLGGIFSSLDIALTTFPLNVVLDRYGINNNRRRVYRLIDPSGRSKFRMEIGPIAALPAGQYEVFYLNSRYCDLLDLNPTVSLMIEDKLIATQDQRFNFSVFTLDVPFSHRLKPHFLRIETDFNGWEQIESMMPDAILLSRRH